MKVIIRSPNWIGDCVMSIPAIRNLKKSSDSIEIFILTKKKLGYIYENLSEVSDIIPLPDRINIHTLPDIIKKIKKTGIKKGILFTNSFSSALLFRIAGVSNLTGFRKDLRGFLLKNSREFPKKVIHQVDFYDELVSMFTGIKTKVLPSNTILLKKSDKKSAGELIRNLGINSGKKIIGFSPFSAYGSAKEWPEDNFSELIKLIGGRKDCEIILFGSPEDNNRLKRIGDNSGVKLHIVGSEFSLKEAILILSELDFFIGNDSGLMHIASALDVPIAGIYGPTMPEKSFPRKKDVFLFYKKVRCSPCSKRECKEEHICMNSITPEEIFNTLSKHI